MISASRFFFSTFTPQREVVTHGMKPLLSRKWPFFGNISSIWFDHHFSVDRCLKTCRHVRPSLRRFIKNIVFSALSSVCRCRLQVFFRCWCFSIFIQFVNVQATSKEELNIALLVDYIYWTLSKQSRSSLSLHTSRRIIFAGCIPIRSHFTAAANRQSHLALGNDELH